MKTLKLLLLLSFFSLTGFSQGLPLEGFESTTGPDALPSTNWTLPATATVGNWAVFDNGTGTGQRWGINTTVAQVYQGAISAYIRNENIGQANTSQDFLATPLITVPTNGKLHFFTRSFSAGNQGTIYKIMVAPSSGTQTNPSSYSTIQQWSETTLNTTFNVYEEKIVDLSPYAGSQIYVAFVMEFTQPTTALGGDRWLIDNVSVSEQCDAPTAGISGSITQTSALLSWTGTAPQYEIEILPQASAQSFSGTIINTNSYAATATTAGAPFTATTAYKYYVRAICSGGVTSAWAGPFNFSTSSPGLSCAAPINITSLLYTTTDNTSNYADNTDVAQPAACAGGATNYMAGNEVFYSYTPTTNGTISVTMTPTTPNSSVFVYSGCANVGVTCIGGVADTGTGVRSIPSISVTAGQQYIIVVSSSAASQTVGYTLVVQRENCAQPTNLNATNIGQTSAELSWGNPGGATSWEVAVQPAGSPIPTGSGIATGNNINYLAGGLTAATPYQYYVRADCGDGTFSSWAGPYLFNTNICDASQQCAYSFVMIDSFGDGWNGGTIQIRQNGIVVATLTGPTVADDQNPVTVTVQMCDGIPYDLFWDTAGNFPGEIGVTVINSFNQTLFVKAPGSGTPGTVLYSNTVHCLTPECLPPTALTVTAISDTSADLGWTPAGPETSWQVFVQATGLPAPAANDPGWTDASTNPFTFAGLATGTTYDFYVRPVCSPTSIGVASAVKTFTTALCPLTSQCNFTFTVVDSFGDGWNGGTMQIRQNGIVVATLTGPTPAQGQNPVNVTVALCDGVPYDLFWNTAGTFPGEMGVTVINSFSQTLFVKAPGTGTAGTVLYASTVNCATPECLPPTNLTATAISDTSADLGWTTSGPETSWQVFVQAAGLPAPTASSVGWIDAPTNPFTYSGLTTGTSYDFYVRPLCSPTDIGSPSGVKNFTTALCPLANQCNYTFNMSDTFGDGWNGGTMQVSQNGIVVATLTGPTNADDLNVISVQVPLCHGIPFELFWNNAGFFPNEMVISIQESLAPQEIIYTKPAGTGTAGTVLFSGTAECFPPTCPKPNSILISSISQTGASVSWTEAGTATQWEIIILPIGSPAPTATSTGIITTDNPYIFTTLTPATGYAVYVRAICSSSDISFWSNVKTFYTLIANDECDFASHVDVNPTTDCVLTTPGSLLGATASIQGNTCGGTDDDDVWFEFTATSNQQSITLLNVAGSTTDLFHVLYSGTCGALTQLYCSDANQSVATGLVIGQTYYIRVYSWTATPGQTSTFDVCVGTIPPPITTDNTLYTVPQLVEDVLLNSSCASVSNVTWSTGTNFNSTNGIAYFNQNGSSFPFADGVVLTTGNAMSAPGPNSTTLSEGDFANWPGDADLEAIILAATGNPMNSENATKLEFDFIPLANTINFNFLFASEEYGTFQCTFSDAFAFLLTDVSTGVTTNLAVVPSTTTPVSVVTIRDEQFNNGCASVNEQYFGDFYGLGGLDPLGAPINFNGTTVPLTATSTVIPGQQYHIKLVIADRQDNLFDSAVFLEGGSLDIGNVDLGTDFLQATNNALCFGDTYTIQSGLDPLIYTFSWTFNTDVIPGETGPNLNIGQSGTYGLTAQYINTTCSATDSIIVEYYDQIVPGNPNNLTACSTTGFAQFDLSQNNAATLGSLSASQYSITYYASSNDALDNLNPLPTLYTNTVANTQTIYVVIKNVTSGCIEIRSFDLIVNPVITPTFTIPTTLCTNDVAPLLPTTSDNGIVGTWAPATVSNTTSGIYVFTPTNSPCGEVITLSISVNPFTTPTFLAPAPICSGAPAPSLPTTSLNGYTGSWTPNVVSNTASGTYTFTPDAGQCAAQTTLNIEVLQNCEFGSFASAVWLSDCDTNDFFNTVGSGASIIGPIANIFPNADLGTYLSFSNTFTLKGSEVKTFKTTTANVCSARMNYRIYPVGGTPGAFTTVNLPFYDDCSGGSFPTGGPCNAGDQKWQALFSAVDLTAFTPGDYAIEVYYDVTGDVNSTTQCDDTIYINNNGANYIATYTLQANPTFTSVNPTTCSATDGSITIGSLAPNTTYSLTYTDDSASVGPMTIVSDNSGNYTLTGLNVGSYTGFTFVVNACTITTTDVVTLTVQSTAVITSTDPLTCNGNSGTITISNLLPNQVYGVSYSDDTVTVGPTSMTSDASGQIILTGLNAGTYTNFNLSNATCTSSSAQTVTLLDPGAPIVSVNSSIICNGQNATVTATPQVPGNYNYVWTVPTGATNPGNVASFTTSVVGTYTVVMTPVSTSFCNGSFESPLATGAFPNMLNESAIPCWDTTAADGIMEVWPAAGFEGVFAYQGTQFIEVNGNSVATVFQDFTTSPGAQLQISFAHRGRQGNDVIGVEIGPTGGPYTSLGNFTDNATWGLHNATYTVPASGGSNYTLRFVSVSSTGGNPSVGNFLDAVSVTSVECSSAPTSGTVTLLPSVTLNLTSANNNQTVCIDTPITTIAYASTNATDITVSGLPAGVTGAFDAGTGAFTITGTPTVSGTFNYVVTTSGGCNVVTLNGTLIVNPTITATFNAITICSGDTVSLPTTSLEGYTGTWNPSTVNNTQTATYIFTPTAGQCAGSGSITITVTQPTPSTFAPINAICNGDTAPVLPATSLEGFTGTWSPSTVNNTQTATYIFTPTTGQCAGNGSITITVTQPTPSTFGTIAPICIGDTAPSLPATSLEGFTGTWSPSVVDNTQSGTYNFTPTAGQCAGPGSLSITVEPAFDFALDGSCIGNDFTLAVTALNESFDVATAHYTWFNSNSVSVGTNSSTFNVTEYLASTTETETLPITFSVEVQTAAGCLLSHPITLDRVFCEIQKGISVNNDGKNEFFDLTGFNVKKLSIFNRYGMAVYSKNNYTNQWVGQSDQGDELPDGTYFYVIDFNDNQSAKSGWIYVNRQQ